MHLRAERMRYWAHLPSSRVVVVVVVDTAAGLLLLLYTRKRGMEMQCMLFYCLAVVLHSSDLSKYQPAGAFRNSIHPPPSLDPPVDREALCG